MFGCSTRVWLTNHVFILVLPIFLHSPLFGPYRFDLYVYFLCQNFDLGNVKHYFYIGFAYVLSKCPVWALYVCLRCPCLALKTGFREFPTPFLYGFCLCFVNIPCLAPFGLNHKILKITYRPRFSVPSKHFSTYEIEGF